MIANTAALDVACDRLRRVMLERRDIGQYPRDEIAARKWRDARRMLAGKNRREGK